ncbi:MAG: hypothetical protein ACR2ME_02350 [Acidimicrobiia bacterium]
MKKPLPVFLAIGAITAIFATLLQKRIEAAQPVDNWEPVSFG